MFEHWTGVLRSVCCRGAGSVLWHALTFLPRRLAPTYLAGRFLRNRARSQELFSLLSDAAYHSQPIALRHPIVFYEGHLPAFSFNTLILLGTLALSLSSAVWIFQDETREAIDLVRDALHSNAQMTNDQFPMTNERSGQSRFPLGCGHWLIGHLPQHLWMPW